MHFYGRSFDQSHTSSFQYITAFTPLQTRITPSTPPSFTMLHLLTSPNEKLNRDTERSPLFLITAHKNGPNSCLSFHNISQP